MNIVAISINSKAGDSYYNDLIEVLKPHKLFEIVGYDSKLLRRYSKEFNISYQPFKIDWNQIAGLSASEIKTNNYGKPYDVKAVYRAADKITDYANSYVVIGKGDYNINKLSQSKELKLLSAAVKSSASKKEYQF